MKTNELAPSSYLTDCVVQFSPSAKIDKSVFLTVPNGYKGFVYINEKLSFRVDNCNHINLLKEYGKAIYKKISRIYDYLNMGDSSISNKEKYEVFMNKLDVLESNLGIDKKFHCIKKEDIPSMTKYALKEANPLYPVPVIWNKKKMIDMYYKIQGD